MIAALFTQLSGNGGVQRLGRQIARALIRYGESHDRDIQLFSYLDGAQETIENHKIYGCSGSSVSFISSLLSQVMSIECLVVTHPFLAPVAYSCHLLSGAPYMVHAHGIEVWTPMNIQRQISIRSAKWVTVSSRDTGRKCRDVQGVRSAKIRVLNPAIDDRFLSHSNELKKKKQVLTVSRLAHADRDKFILESIRAFAQLSEKFHDWSYRIVGDGSQRSRYQNLIERYHQEEKIKLLGRIDDDLLLREYQDASIFLLPSMKEGFGIVYLEALASQTPCIGGSVGGCCDAIAHGVDGTLVDPRNPKELTESLENLMANEELRRNYGNAGRHKVCTKFREINLHRRFHMLLKEHEPCH